MAPDWHNQDDTDDYAEYLRASGRNFVTDGIWARSGTPTVDQGWKLHLSSTPLDGGALLLVTLPVLKSANVAFKVARSSKVLELLNAGRFNSTQVGKFITIYPEDGQSARRLALEILHVIRGFDGPRIPTDLHLGGSLYSRYGAFRSQPMRDVLGSWHNGVFDSNGCLIPDTYSVPYAAPENIENPFDGIVTLDLVADAAHHRLAGRYLLLEPLQARAKGSIFLALDLFDQAEVAPCVVKQARRLTMSDRSGRDACWRLRREYALHRILAGTEVAPRALDFFEESGDAYLVLEHIEGRQFELAVNEQLGNRPWADVSCAQRQLMLRWALGLISATAELHRHGWVHRDISVNNVLVRSDDSIVLIDLEMAASIGMPQHLVGSGTTGFARPAALSGRMPEAFDDTFSVAAVLVFLISGMDPRRLRQLDASTFSPAIRHLAGEAAELNELITAITDILLAPQRSIYTLDALAGIVSRAGGRLEQIASGIHGDPRAVSAATPIDLESLISFGIAGLLDPRAPYWDELGLWRSPPTGLDTEQVIPSDLCAHRSAYRGVAGVVYLLARCSSQGFQPAELLLRLRNGIQFLAGSDSSPDHNMPGLYFGEAGVIVALREAGCPAERDTDRLHGLLRQTAANNIDVTHGVAGIGIAALISGDYDLAVDCARSVIQRQLPDGGWTTDFGSAASSPMRLTGFAHGAAGLVYFLATLSFIRKDAQIIASWQRGMEWLDRMRRTRSDGRMEWPHSEHDPAVWQWWCHGAPGISLAYLRAYEVTRESRYLAAAESALRDLPTRMRHGNFGFCHGLAGLGEIYIEWHRVTGDPTWQARARDIAATFSANCWGRDHGRIQWLSEHPELPLADLAVGSAGILHFLLRLHDEAQTLSFPLLLDLPSLS